MFGKQQRKKRKEKITTTAEIRCKEKNQKPILAMCQKLSQYRCSNAKYYPEPETWPCRYLERMISPWLFTLSRKTLCIFIAENLAQHTVGRGVMTTNRLWPRRIVPKSRQMIRGSSSHVRRLRFSFAREDMRRANRERNHVFGVALKRRREVEKK